MTKLLLLLRYFSFFAILLLAAFLFQGCELFDSEEHSVRITTDQPSYSKSAGESIDFQAVNRSGLTLYQYSPADAILEKLEDGVWVERGTWYAVPAIAGSPQAIPHGGEINIPDFPSDDLILIDIKPGTYRVKTFIYENQNMERLIPLEQRISNAFEITE